MAGFVWGTSRWSHWWTLSAEIGHAWALSGWPVPGRGRWHPFILALICCVTLASQRFCHPFDEARAFLHGQLSSCVTPRERFVKKTTRWLCLKSPFLAFDSFFPPLMTFVWFYVQKKSFLNSLYLLEMMFVSAPDKNWYMWTSTVLIGCTMLHLIPKAVQPQTKKGRG